MMKDRIKAAALAGCMMVSTVLSTSIPVEMAYAEDVIDECYNLLLIGVDRREEGWYGNSDVMILATVNDVEQTVYLTSFLRDLYAEIPGVGVRKLNAACANGGPKLVIETLETTYGLEIDNYAMVDFNGMIGIVDALGGIDLEIDEDEKNIANDYILTMCEANEDVYEEHVIEESGYVHLDGYQTTGYCRNRFSGSDNDFGRTNRQRKVLNALLHQLGNVGLTDIPGIAIEIMKNVDTDLSVFTLADLATNLGTWLNYDIEGIHIPFDNEYYVQDEILIPTDLSGTIQKLREMIY